MGKAITAMLVDDEQIGHMIYKRVIKRSGAIEKTISFCYPDEALAYLKTPDREEIDVIFLDINMPRLSGFEFLDQALAGIGPDFAKIPVVMLTTSLAPEEKIRASSYEVVKGFLTKPLTVDDVEHVVSLLSDEDQGAKNKSCDL